MRVISFLNDTDSKLNVKEHLRGVLARVSRTCIQRVLEFELNPDRSSGFSDHVTH